MKILKGYNKHPPVILPFIQLHSNPTQKTSQPAINTGIPEVTSEQVTAFINEIVIGFYEFAAEISPQITLLVLIVGGIAGIFFNEAKKAVFWAIIGMLLILWGPQLIGLLSNLKIN